MILGLFAELDRDLCLVLGLENTITSIKVNTFLFDKLVSECQPQLTEFSTGTIHSFTLYLPSGEVLIERERK